MGNVTNAMASLSIAFLLANSAASIIGCRPRKEVADESTNFKCTWDWGRHRAGNYGCSAESDEGEEDLSRLHVCWLSSGTGRVELVEFVGVDSNKFMSFIWLFYH
jgi:hypothetical protein